ncbi:MAG: hypothetical protein ACXACY_12980 [Candidatus Hodarchaeales archaeon]
MKMAIIKETIYIDKYDIEVECEIEYEYPPYRAATFESPAEGGCVTIFWIKTLPNDLDVSVNNYINDILFEDSDFIEKMEAELQNEIDEAKYDSLADDFFDRINDRRLR